MQKVHPVFLLTGFIVIVATLMLAGAWLVSHFAEDSIWRFVVILAPMIPVFVLALRLEWKQYQCWDELKRRMHLEALMVASTAMVVFCGSAVMLEYAGMNSPPIIAAVAVHALSYMVALQWLKRSYR